ncbi:hypothetical protein Franean1_0855 [Parafrankia sp. EAN1pec]|nr:hypothetical protein Franean1_0855 [Frankia sp. EAN1pec]
MGTRTSPSQHPDWRIRAVLSRRAQHAGLPGAHSSPLVAGVPVRPHAGFAPTLPTRQRLRRMRLPTVHPGASPHRSFGCATAVATSIRRTSTGARSIPALDGRDGHGGRHVSGVVTTALTAGS